MQAVELKQHGDGIKLCGRNAQLRADLWDADGNRWVPVPLHETDDVYTGACALGQLTLELALRNGIWNYRLLMLGAQPTRARLAIELASGLEAWHLMPGFMHGDNELDADTGSRRPHLTSSTKGSACSPFWECRADRCSHPFSLLATDDAILAISIDPYSDDAHGGSGSSLANGLEAACGDPESGPLAGVTLGYRNRPSHYVCGNRFEESVGDFAVTASTSGAIYAIKASSRLAIHQVVRREHERLRPIARHPQSRHHSEADRQSAIDALCWGIGVAGWDSERQELSNLNWNHERCRFEAGKVGHGEIAWTAGAPLAYPLLVAGLAKQNTAAITRSRMILDRIANAVNPASGLLHDAVNARGECIHGWWSHFNCTAWEHFAYINGQALYYLLCAAEHDKAAPGRDQWIATAEQVLGNVMKLQSDNGALPFEISRTTGKVLDMDGFAPCWFVAALAMAHRVTGNQSFLTAAIRGFEHYRRDVGNVHCYGTPLDTFKAPDQEGSLAFIKAARVLHEATHEEHYLTWLGHGLEYEYLWRYAYRTRPPFEPLRSAIWSACGGSITSSNNPHVHPMGVMIQAESRLVAARTGDAYHAARSDDQLAWALESLSVYPKPAGFGYYGTLSERFCPSDGLVIETHPDGRPWAVWFTHHGWGAANILEGLIGQAINRS